MVMARANLIVVLSRLPLAAIVNLLIPIGAQTLAERPLLDIGALVLRDPCKASLAVAGNPTLPRRKPLVAERLLVVHYRALHGARMFYRSSRRRYVNKE